MVSQSQEQPEASTPPDNSGGTTTDITSEFEGVNTFEDVSTSPEDIAPEAPVTEEATTETPPAPDTAAPVAEAPETPATPEPEVPDARLDDLQERIQKQEEQVSYYQNQQQQQQLQQQAYAIRQQYEQQGYLPEQATQAAQQWLAQQNAVAQQQQEHQRQVSFLQGQANAAEHFANKYGLGLNDLAELRKHPNPDAMEEAAKGIKSIRDKDAEIAELRAKLVPSQNFDNSQSTPAASNDEDRWLDRYNQGDRSAQAQEAARRAAGLG